MSSNPSASIPIQNHHLDGMAWLNGAAVEAVRLVQQHLFPRSMPRAAGWDFAAHSRPANGAGGDYYDLFETAPGQIAVALGDVCGKGAGAALVVAELHALIRGRLPGKADDLPALVGEINRYLVEFTPPDLFVSLFVAAIDVHTGWMRYVNAGHVPPLLLSGRGAWLARLGPGGTLLGLFPEADYEMGEARIEPAGLLAVFSDGLTEARNGDGEMFREKRVRERCCRRLTPARPRRSWAGCWRPSTTSPIGRGKETIYPWWSCSGSRSPPSEGARDRNPPPLPRYTRFDRSNPYPPPRAPARLRRLRKSEDVSDFFPGRNLLAR